MSSFDKKAMEKILLAVAGEEQHPHAVDFACYLARLTHSRLIGAFLVNNSATSDEAVRRFREACVCRDVPARIHRDGGVPLEEMLQESRFSDLLVVDPETSFGRNGRKIPGQFVENVLAGAECPVIVVPFTFEAVEAVYFCFDGRASSMYAIRQFTYLFPEFRHKKAIVLCAVEGEPSGLDGETKLKEWLSVHYTDSDIVHLQGEAGDELFGYLLEKKDAMVVLGAYGRGELSRMFKPSTAALLLKTLNLPIFIAHR
jgi:nucleotide-binding universal stress UspA family protein